MSNTHLYHTRKTIKRREVTQLISSGILLLQTAPMSVLAASGTQQKSMEDIEKIRNDWREFQRPGLQLPSSDELLSQSEHEWQQSLSPERFAILREAETEALFSSSLNSESRDGLFVCAACGLALFSSPMKYDSGTGWPSFFTHIPGVLETKLDFSMILPRTEYHCARCASHQGHRFNDGPAPTYKRWCNNGLALRFEPLESAGRQL